MYVDKDLGGQSKKNFWCKFTIHRWQKSNIQDSSRNPLKSRNSISKNDLSTS